MFVLLLVWQLQRIGWFGPELRLTTPLGLLLSTNDRSKAVSNRFESDSFVEGCLPGD